MADLTNKSTRMFDASTKSRGILFARKCTDACITVGLALLFLSFSFLRSYVLQTEDYGIPEFNELKVQAGIFRSVPCRYASCTEIVVPTTGVRYGCGECDYDDYMKDIGSDARAWISPGGALYQLEVGGRVRVPYDTMVQMTREKLFVGVVSMAAAAASFFFFWLGRRHLKLGT